VNSPANRVCWICQERPADSTEHRFKASDIRRKAPAVSQRASIRLHHDGEATNRPVASAKSKALTFPASICSYCNNELTQPYDRAWERLSRYLHENRGRIAQRGTLDMLHAFPDAPRIAALNVHLDFLKLFGCKLHADEVPISLTEFSAALRQGEPHPEVALMLAASPVESGEVFLGFESMSSGLQSARRRRFTGRWGCM
jgi:hypothetical protein